MGDLCDHRCDILLVAGIMKKTDDISWGLIVICLVIVSFATGFFTCKEMEEDRHNKRDTIVFKHHGSDSVKLYVVLENGRLQTFWYKKFNRWKIKPTLSK